MVSHDLRCRWREELPEPELQPGATFKIVGIGGVGSICARYLAVFLAALDRQLRLVLIDGDAFEPSNAARQLFARLGNKAEVVAEELTGDRLAVAAITEYLTPENIARVIRDGDHVLAAVDNHATRKLLTEHCATLRDVLLVSGGNDGVGGGTRGSRGSVQVQLRRDGSDITPPLTRLHPEIAEPDDRRPDQLDCLSLADSQPQLLFTNLTTAACMLNTLSLCIRPDALAYSELAFDTADALMRPLLPLALPDPNACETT